MDSGPKYTLIGSGVIVVISVILFVFGSTVDVDVESEAVFKGTEGTVELSDQTTYTVFVNADSDCYDAEIVVTDGTWDYFNQDCDEIMDEDGWKHAGILAEASGTLEVTSNYEIIIVDDMVYLESGGSILVGACICCLGVIGLIVGAIWANSSKGQPVPQMVIMPQQQQVPMQVPLTTTGYTPGDLIITQQEEERDV